MPRPNELPDFSKLRVAVIGDLVADHYLETEPRSLSREAPVMVLRHRAEYFRGGGAANVARNLAALGAETLCLGAVGRDAAGRATLEQLESAGVDVARVRTVPGWVTPTKTRIVSAEPRRNPQQVLRIDREPEHPVEDAVATGVIQSLLELAERIDAVVVSDYEYGLVRAELAAAAVRMAQRGSVVVLDPRVELDGFAGITALTPNIGEVARFTGRAPESLQDLRELARAASELRARVRPRYLLVTRGNLGMAVFGEDCPAAGLLVPASGAGNVTDVSGAGDTAAAVFALALASGADAARAMLLANAASGIVVMEHGTAVCTPAQLRAALGAAPNAGDPTPTAQRSV